MRPRRESSPSPFSHIILTGRVISTVDFGLLAVEGGYLLDQPVVVEPPERKPFITILDKGDRNVKRARAGDNKEQESEGEARIALHLASF